MVWSGLKLIPNIQDSDSNPPLISHISREQNSAIVTPLYDTERGASSRSTSRFHRRPNSFPPSHICILIHAYELPCLVLPCVRSSLFHAHYVPACNFGLRVSCFGSLCVVIVHCTSRLFLHRHLVALNAMVYQVPNQCNCFLAISKLFSRVFGAVIWSFGILDRCASA